MTTPHLDHILQQIRQCQLCIQHLPLGPRPVVQASSTAKLLIIGQAPGIRVHETGIPFNDPSGDRLRDWLGIDRELFYDLARVAIMPMGFCYPGTGKSGDLPPRKECAPQWHQQIVEQLPQIELTLLIGLYAQQYYLPTRHKNLTDTVRHWQQYQPQFLPLPHPSPRNNIWLKRNPWFSQDVLPSLKHQVTKLFNLPQ